MLTGEMIRAEIVQALKKQNLTSNPAIDSSRQFPKCPSSIQVESLFGSWKTVEISCPDTSWKLAIRTNTTDVFLGTQGQNFEEDKPNTLVVSINTSLNRGDVVKDKHLTVLKAKKNMGGGVFDKKDQVVGRTLKRPLSKGTIIRVRHLTPDWIIMKDQIVMIEHMIGNIIINAQGVAQESGQIGQRIWVNNFNSGKKVLCWIKNDRKVTTNAKVY